MFEYGEFRMLKTWEPVLVVDDSQAMGDIMKQLLISIGFGDVEIRTNAIEGMSELKERPYTLVICDLDMRPIDGLQFVQMIRSDTDTWRTPVLLTTASKALAVEALKGGACSEANGFILKPFTAVELKAKLAEVLEAKYLDRNLMPTRMARLNGDWAPSRKREMIEETLINAMKRVGLHTPD
jgi:two-component system chemotaxis response regulator CheY